MPEPVVTFSKSDSIGYITLDRPPANSFKIEFMCELDTAIEGANYNPAIRAVILQSATEKFFSAGADLRRSLNDCAWVPHFAFRRRIT